MITLAKVSEGRRLPFALFLFGFAPVSAEYLIGYDTIAGDPFAMVFGLVVFAPLYGAPALLIRELVRRTGRGWPSILVLGAAFGLLQAGLIDQGLFNPAYRDIPYWEAVRAPTLLAPLGTSAFMLFHFTALHAFGSVYAPVAVAEALSGRARERPWLRLPGLIVIVLSWLAAAGYVAVDHVLTEGWQPTPAQMIGTLVAVVLLCWLAFRLPAPGTPPEPGSPASPLGVALISLVLIAPRPVLAALSPVHPMWNSWPPTLFAVATTVLWLVIMVRWSGSPGWSPVHQLAAAAGYLFAVAGTAFLVTPLGEVDLAAKYGSNLTLLLLVAVLTGTGWSIQHRMLRQDQGAPKPVITPQ
ncbi:hypothetical protein [Microlunatus parietis]|uniref:Uncharacterized protein n=1 Tax=Microlunatus parietis TaxID=682979 RepID=A0A7Y9IC75_9ACTN|nr:hypothetical protein [Microlunatus parietis]NYE73913.1 hypothetical protein [Microlunatus parietis]